MPAIKYLNKAGVRVPSVTTVLRQVGWNRDALMYWAWTQGVEGKNYRDASSGAANVGTIVHAAAEASLKGQPFDLESLDGLTDEDAAAIRLSIDAWDRWRDQTRLQPVASESSLVSEEYQFGGTLDVCMIHKRRSILDIKTTKGVYPDVLMQIRAYGALWEEVNGEPIEDYYVLRLGKEDGSWHHHNWPADGLPMKKAWRGFLNCRDLYQIEKLLKKAT